MKDRIEQTKNRLEKDLVNISFNAKKVLEEKGELMRKLNELINTFEGEKLELESELKECDLSLKKLNDNELTKRAQLAILNEI